MDPDRTDYRRSVYTWFDMLADVGGFLICVYLVTYVLA